jgi:hypothetical protein
MNLSQIRLIDGPVVDIKAHKRELVAQMAKDLIRFDAVADERDAIRALSWCGRYSAYDVLVLLDDARQVAMQEIVAKEISKP